MIEDAVLPALLALIMFGVGLDLRAGPRSLRALAVRPVLVGLIGVAVLLPAAGIAVATWFDGDPALKIGLILLAISPVGLLAGPLAARMRHNVAVAVTLTGVTSLIYLLLAPQVIAALLRATGVPIDHVLLPPHLLLQKIVLVALLPALAGAILARHGASDAARMSRALGHITTPCLVLVLTWIIVENRDTLLETPGCLLLAVVLIDLVAVAIATALGRVFRLSASDRGALVLAHLMRQEGIGIFVAVSLLALPVAAAPLIANTIIALLFSGALGFRRLCLTHQIRLSRPIIG